MQRLEQRLQPQLDTRGRRRPGPVALASLLLLSLLLAISPPAAHGQAPPSITYLRYDAEIAIAAGGSFTVREIQRIRFDGQYSTAFAEIPLDYVTRIDGDPIIYLYYLYTCRPSAFSDTTALEANVPASYPDRSSSSVMRARRRANTSERGSARPGCGLRQ